MLCYNNHYFGINDCLFQKEKSLKFQQTLVRPWVSYHGGSLSMKYHITSIHIGGLNTPKTFKNILPRIKGSRGVLIWHSNINIGGYFIWEGWRIKFKSLYGFIYIYSLFFIYLEATHKYMLNASIVECKHLSALQEKWHFNLM